MIIKLLPRSFYKNILKIPRYYQIHQQTPPINYEPYKQYFDFFMDTGKRIKDTTEGTIQMANGKIGQPFPKRDPNPKFQESRAKYFDQILARQKELIDKAEKPKITITLKDGKQIEGIAFVTTAEEALKKLPKKVAENMVAARVKYTKKYDSIIGAKVVDTDEHESEDNQVAENEQIYDLHRPIEGDCLLEFVDFEDPVGKQVFWHSSAHMLGSAVEQYFGSQLCIGPPLQGGFYYDSYMGDVKVTQDDYKAIEDIALKLSQSKQVFEKVYLTKKEALELFADNIFKVQLINAKVPEGSMTSAYKCGNLIDLCTGPHLPNTNRVKSFKILKNSAAYWLGNKENDDLQRIYGIAFPSKKQLDEYIKIQEELAKRDHRNIGKQQELFTFNQFAPGCGFFHPKGAHIYNKIMEELRHQYNLRGYSEVVTPNMYDSALWKISGHWTKYKDNMFLVNSDEAVHGFKPMNCPGHMLMFDSIQRSYRDLPIRFADFGVLHRNELHGALSGLTRVRRFQQDDAHIFCRLDQIQSEILQALDFIDYIYSIFGFEYKLWLSTRPDNYLGTVEMWDEAESQLKSSLDQFGKAWKENPKDGAFYGPKIDIQLFDAFGRAHQCGTIQLDFNGPIRFNLQYRAAEGEKDIKKQKKDQEDNPEKHELPLMKAEQKEKDFLEKQQLGEECKSKEPLPGYHSIIKPDHIPVTSDESVSETSSKKDGDHEKKYHLQEHHIKLGFQRPVVIHRAVIGSFERFIAILCEQTAGKWPFWLSPNQVMIIPTGKEIYEYGQLICNRLKIEGFNVSIDVSGNTLQKKVRNAEVDSWNFIAVVGHSERDSGSVDLRESGQQEKQTLGKFSIEQLIKKFKIDNKPTPAKLEQILWDQAYQGNKEIKSLEEILQNQYFLSGEGLALGDKDLEEFNKLKEQTIDNQIYPNVSRWQNYVKKQSVNKQ